MKNIKTTIENCTSYSRVSEETLEQFKKRMYKGVDLDTTEFREVKPPFALEIRCIRIFGSTDKTYRVANIELGYCGKMINGDPVFSEDKRMFKKYHRLCAVKAAIEKLNKIVGTTFEDYYVFMTVVNDDNQIKKITNAVLKTIKLKRGKDTWKEQLG